MSIDRQYDRHVIDTELLDAIDSTLPEAGKSLLTNLNNEEVVLGDPKGQKCNTTNQIIDEQGAAIPGKINTTLFNEKKYKLPLQDNLDPIKTYSNRSEIKLPENNVRSELNLDFLVLVRQIPFHGSPSEHPHNHIEKLEDMVDDDYCRCKLFSFSLAGEAMIWLNQLPDGSLTCWKEIRSAFVNNFFDEERYWEARKNILTFSQGAREPFKDAGGRFRSYQLECPHHGFPEIQLLNIFCSGLDWTYQAVVLIGHTKQF